MTQITEAYKADQLVLSAREPVWIRDTETLIHYCKQWAELPLIAVDTEFMRVDTFYPIPALIQVADEYHCYLIDPLSVEDMSAFAALLADVRVLKVLHAASEDLELFRHHYGVIPEPLMDTQVAAAFAGWGFSMGLQRILQHALDITLGKAHTRSDWLQRPLTDEQILYAALDVAYLPTIAMQLKSELQTSGRYEWMLDECRMLGQSSRDNDPGGLEYYRRFTQLNINSEVTLAGLRDLAAWRERVCRERNLCRPHVLRNEHLIKIIECWPQTLEQLNALGLLRRQNLKTDGEAILAVLSQAEASAKQNPPEPINLPLHIYHSATLKRLKVIGREVSKAQQIMPELLVRRRDLEKLINSKDDQGHFHLPETLSGWRKALIGDQLLKALETQQDTRVNAC
ncbi:ribonuclease D [Nitrincola iocasae]|uniref:Ribonuclease D n=1 Tax=Nitrincola iocasae TaxID=2614693 RepID=A0A5J6LFB3_9GAMM|nr:ribonuclease D [Nitrincola iocasae]QEW07309.1 ribonuclease D [Nitrincola iocasae]